MGKELVMNLEEAFAMLDSVSNASVVLAKPPFTWGSEAEFVEVTDDYRVPQNFLDAGYEYLIGVEDALYMVSNLAGKRIGARAVVEFVVHWAIHDAPPAWFNDLSGM
jgi:hypothetical protein